MEVQVVNGMEVVVIPEVLRAKLGDNGAKELACLLNTVARGAKEATVELMVERFEKRLAQTESRLTWRVFLFWVGQVAATAALLQAFFRFFLKG